MFQERVQAAGLANTEWLALEGDVGEVASLCARYSDLAVIGQTDPEGPTAGSARDLPERMLLGSGRPALVVPYAGRFDSIGQRVLVAWNGSREATRAVNDALPLLERASRVIVLSVNPPDPGSGRGAPPGADIALHLARHGVRAEASAVTTEDVRVDDMLLSQASDVNADLLVMGAYGHSRLGELVLGGATRHMPQADHSAGVHVALESRRGPRRPPPSLPKEPIAPAYALERARAIAGARSGTVERGV